MKSLRGMMGTPAAEQQDQKPMKKITIKERGMSLEASPLCMLEGKVVGSRKIEAGECILSEAPLFVLSSSRTIEDVKLAISHLSPAATLAFNSLKLSRATQSNTVPSDVPPDALALFNSNCWPLGDSMYPFETEPVTGSGIFPILNKLEHSCSPNTGYHYEQKLGRILVHAFDSISEKVAITISLVDPFLTRAERQERLERRFGIDCSCKACSLKGEEAELSDHRRERIKTLFVEMPDQNDASLAIRRCEEALHLLRDEGIKGWHGCWCYDAFQFAVGVSDFVKAKAWIARAHAAYERERGAQSEDTLKMKTYLAAPHSHPATGVLLQKR